MRNSQGVVANLASLFAEDRTEQLLFRGEFRLALRRHLADQNIARVDLRAYSDYAAVIKILQHLVVEVRDITGDLLRTELCLTAFKLVFLYMN